MAWNLKSSSWDFSELDGGLPNIESTVDNSYNDIGSTRFGFMKESDGGEFCVDLKLGRVGNTVTEPSGPKWKSAASAVGGGEGGVSKTASTSSGSGGGGTSKRARGINNGIQTASCLVDGCSSDLSNCREYHRRHKVCELHSKTPVVFIGGHKQRFCQQCSRFHSLEEFDEGKRSCRKRLDGHNRRRRKPQPVPLTRTSASLVFSNYHTGRHVLQFSSDSNLYPSGTIMNPGCDFEWDDRTMIHNNKQLFLGISENSRIKQETTTMHSEKTCIEALGMATVTGWPGSFSSSPPPPCALSLLSSPPPASMCVSSQPLAAATALHDQGLQEGVDTTLLVSNIGSHQPSMYNLLGSSDDSHANNSHSLPFHWE